MTKSFEYALIGLTMSIPVLVALLLEHYELVPSTPTTTISIVSVGVVTVVILFMSTIMSFQTRGKTA